MKKSRQRQLKSESFKIHYKHPLAHHKLSDAILAQLPQLNDEIIVMCIGTDRSTGDALGPLVGSLFTMVNPKKLKVYGSLHKPIHAINLEEYLNYINSTYKNPYIIAIDASLGRKESIGSLITGLGSIKPGAAVNKSLPPVGDIHLIAVVNFYSMTGYSVLQTTRLSIIYDMATVISKALTCVDKALYPKSKYQKMK